MEALLEKLMAGESLPVKTVDVDVKGLENYKPVTKDSVCYIVCAIILGDDNQVLMMQEAKPTCYGTWYLPAGRMEVGENIEEGVQREVLEETGLEMEVESLLSVEATSGFWYRFTVTGRVSGGKLKTCEEKDKESLQAKWMSVDVIRNKKSDITLRSSDIIPLLDLAVQHKTATSRHPNIMPTLQAHTQLLLRLVFLHHVENENSLKMLIAKKDSLHLPVAVISPKDRCFQITLFRVLENLFGHTDRLPQVQGVLNIEHCGKPATLHDGICITLLATFDEKDRYIPKPKNKSQFEWSTIENLSLQNALKDMLTGPPMSVPFLMR